MSKRPYHRRYTLQQFIERRYIPEYLTVALAETTQAVYMQAIDDRIIPALGYKDVAHITQSDVSEFYASLRRDGARYDGKPGGLAQSTVEKIAMVLSCIFRCAVDWEVIDRNPCKKVMVGVKRKKRKAFALSPQDANQFMAALAHEHIKYRLIACIALILGDRRGEVVGLRWSRINMDTCIFTVDHTCIKVKGGCRITNDVKTDAGERDQPFTPLLLPLLEEYRAWQDEYAGKRWQKWHDVIDIDGYEEPNDLLFTTHNGKPMHPNTINAWFTKFKRKNNLPERLKFHSLRSTSITLMLTHGVDAGTVADLHGHSDKAITLNMYHGAMPEVQRAAADLMGNLLGDNLYMLAYAKKAPSRR